jgi:hypothetical protein
MLVAGGVLATCRDGGDRKDGDTAHMRCWVTVYSHVDARAREVLLNDRVTQAVASAKRSNA